MIQETGVLGGMQIINGETSGADATGGAEQYENYFGFEETVKHFLPDGKQWIAFKPLNEGERAQYEAKTQRDISFNRKTDDAKISINASSDRHALIMQSVCDWHMVQRTPTGEWVAVAFTKGSGGVFAQWLSRANPKIVNDLYAAIQRANPWMMNEMTTEMIEEEIKRLEELLSETRKREEQQKNS